MSRAYDNGIEAGMAAKRVQDCPYSGETPASKKLQLLWLEGYVLGTRRREVRIQARAAESRRREWQRIYNRVKSPYAKKRIAELTGAK